MDILSLRRHVYRFGSGVVLFCLALGGPIGPAAFGVPAQPFDLPAGSLDAALKAFGEQSPQQVIVPTELTNGVQVQAVKGSMTPARALDRLLSGTPLAATVDSTSGAFAIVLRQTIAAHPARNAVALIVIGLSAEPAQETRYRNEADALRDAFEKRGIAPAAISILPATTGTRIRRDAVLAALHAVPTTVAETWVVLLGSAAPGQDGAPAYQVSGPRISSTDLAGAVAALPGNKFVVLGLANGGGFLAPLAPLPKVEAIAATAASGEVNEPRFAALWADALADNPDATFVELAQEAASRVSQFYADHGLGQGEHAQWLDRSTGKIVAAP